MTPEYQDYLAQKAANWTWGFAIIAAIVWWKASFWWALLPAVLAIWFAAASVAATMDAQKLRDSGSRRNGEDAEGG